MNFKHYSLILLVYIVLIPITACRMDEVGHAQHFLQNKMKQIPQDRLLITIKFKVINAYVQLQDSMCIFSKVRFIKLYIFKLSLGMYSKKSFLQKPVHLVSINSYGKLVLHFEAVNYLNTLKSPISVLSIAGPYRTGKSFLLNSLISSSQNIGSQEQLLPSFQVSHTTNQNTHGCWIWSKPILAQDDKNQVTNVIIMDSEGYAGSQNTHDKRLVTLAFLLSSCFLFNSKGPIEKDSLVDLQFIIEIARMIGQKEQLGQTDLQEKSRGNCDFHWILRDFHLQLVNQLGCKITSNQYMQNCLLQVQHKVNHKTIQTLKEYFPQRNCHTLCRPDLQQNKEERPEFISQILGLKQKILKKGMKSFNMGGQAFAVLVKSYVDAMNNGQQIQSVFQQGKDCRVRLNCLQKLTSRLKRLQTQSSSKLLNPREQQQVDEKLLNIRSELKHYYKERMFSIKQIKVLENQVQMLIREYQQGHCNNFNANTNSYNNSNNNNVSSKAYITSVRCMDSSNYNNNNSNNSNNNNNSSNNNNNSSNDNNNSNNNNKSSNNNIYNKSREKILSNRKMLAVPPRTQGSLVRLSIHCSQSQQKSFMNDEESNQDISNIRGSRFAVINRKSSADKLKTSPQVKHLTMKVQELQLKLHRTQLYLSTGQSQILQLRNENQSLKHLLTVKQDQLATQVQKIVSTLKQNCLKQEALQEQLKQQQKKNLILQSQIQKMTLLYKQKVQFLQRQILQGDQERVRQFVKQNDKYKSKVRQLSEELQYLKSKHEEEVLQLRQIFTQRQSQKMKTFMHFGSQYQTLDGKNVFEELQDKMRQNQSLKEQLQKSKLQNQKVGEDLVTQSLKSQQKQQSLKDQIQQLNKRIQSSQSNLTSIYQSKLQSKDAHILQLENKIKVLNSTVLTQNQRLIQSLRQLELHHSEQKEDLYSLNNQLRNGCLQALQRVSGLKQQIEMKQTWMRQQQQEKKQLGDRLSQLRHQHQKQLARMREGQRLLRHKLNQQKQSQGKLEQQVQHQTQQQSQQLSELQKTTSQLAYQLQQQKQASNEHHQYTQQLEQKVRWLQCQNHDMQQQLISKQQQLQSSQEDYSSAESVLKRQLSQVKSQLLEAIREKTQLEQSLSKINRQLTDKCQELSVTFEQKYSYQAKKYEQSLKQIKQNQRRQVALSDKYSMDLAKSQANARSLEKQLNTSTKQYQHLKGQVESAKRQSAHKITQHQQRQRQAIKQVALLAHKMNFNQQQLTQLKQQSDELKQQSNNKSQQQQEKQQQFQQIIIQLKEQLKQQAKRYKQIQSGMSVINRLNAQQAKELACEIDQNKQLVSKMTQTNQSLTKQLNMHLHDNQILRQNLLQLRQHIRQQQIRTENHFRLFSDKLNKVKKQKFQLQVILQQERKYCKEMVNQLQLLKNNYSSDFQLWTKKLEKMERNLKQAGWKEFSVVNRDRTENGCVAKVTKNIVQDKKLLM